MEQPPFTIAEVTDPVEIEQFRTVFEHAARNRDWLEGHWGELLPQALGRFVAVAGQEAFIADTSPEAQALAVAAHPDDKGVIVQYVLPRKGPQHLIIVC